MYNQKIGGSRIMKNIYIPSLKDKGINEFTTNTGIKIRRFMNKREDIQIYILSHKPVSYGIWNDELYTPLQVGDADSFISVRDDKGVNICNLNPMYAETTGIYWIWKNTSTRYKGQCQYRRRLEFPTDYDFDTDFKYYSVITMQPIALAATVYNQYAACHSKKDMDLLEEIINEDYPEYSGTFQSVIKNGNILFYSNGFIMPNGRYDMYCEWLFGILGKFRERMGWNTNENLEKDIAEDIARKERSGEKGVKYQMQVLGFLSERLLTLWLMTNTPPFLIKTVPYKKYENLFI
jgi:hypothetical protein